MFAEFFAILYKFLPFFARFLRTIRISVGQDSRSASYYVPDTEGNRRISQYDGKSQRCYATFRIEFIFHTDYDIQINWIKAFSHDFYSGKWVELESNIPYLLCSDETRNYILTWSNRWRNEQPRIDIDLTPIAISANTTSHFRVMRLGEFLNSFENNGYHDVLYVFSINTSYLILYCAHPELGIDTLSARIVDRPWIKSKFDEDIFQDANKIYQNRRDRRERSRVRVYRRIT